MDTIKLILLIFIIVVTFCIGYSYPAEENTVNLRVYFEKILGDHVAKDELRFSLLDKALVLQSVEMERRLEGLNQLRQDVVSDRSIYLRKDTFDNWLNERRVWQDQVNKSITQMYTVVSVIGFLIVIVNVILRWFPKKP